MIGSDVLDEVDGCEFGDARLNARLHRIVARFAEKPNVSIPSACLGRAETEAAYRFFSNKKVSSDAIFEAHARSTLRRIRQTKNVLLVQDTTQIDLSRPGSEVEGAGPLGCEKQLGALYHPLIAYEPSGLPLGTVWNRRWVRKGIHPGGIEEKHQARKCLPIEEKESFRWLEGLRQAREVARQCPDTLCVCVGDSESDIYEMFSEPRQTEHGQVHLLIRGCYDRAIKHDEASKEHRTILRALRAQPVLAKQTIDISQRRVKKLFSKDNRKVPREARTVTVSIQAGVVEIIRPRRCSETFPSKVEVNVVLVEETSPPEGETPIQWFLLTTLPINTKEEVQDVITNYCCRWQIEVYFRTLKSGCRIEERYFQRYTRLENCLAIYTIIAWRILYLCRLSQDCPDLSCEVVFGPSEWKPVVLLIDGEIPNYPPKLNEMVRKVASLGGYVTRTTTQPGAQTLWLGLQRVHDMATAWELFGPDRKT